MDPYKVLGVSENDTNVIIKRKFKKLAIKHHPDKGGDSDRFIKINEAYTKLIGNEKKQKKTNETPNSNLNIFKAFLHKQIMKEYKDLFLTLEEMYTGKKIKINLTKYVDCGNCTKSHCCTCNGTGKIKVTYAVFGIQQKINQDCNICDGFGYTRECSECDNGYISKNVIYVLKIKKGCNEDDRYSVENNTIIFVIKQKKHPRFLRHDNDLILHKSISLYEAVSCLRVKCKHLNNKIYTFSTSKTIQNDIIYRLDNLGMPHKSSNIFGNLYIKFDILLPTKCNFSNDQDLMVKSLFSITNYDIDDKEFPSESIELKYTNEDILDISLVRLIRSNY